MKPQSILAGAVLGAVLAGATLLIAGCEVQSADLVFTIDPAYVELHQNESTDFAANGADGFEFSWSLSPDDGSGILSAKTGQIVHYTCVSSSTGAVQTVTCTATPPHTTVVGGATASNGVPLTATATVVFK